MDTHVPAPTFQQAVAEKLLIVVLLTGMVAYIAKTLYNSRSLALRRARSSDELVEIVEDSEGEGEDEGEETEDKATKNKNHSD
jgi:hypothetical protein